MRRTIPALIAALTVALAAAAAWRWWLRASRTQVRRANQ